MSYTVPAVDTAIRLLKYLKDNNHSQKSLAEACDVLGIPRSTGFNIMKTLEKHSMVKFDVNSRRYSLGWALVELGTRAAEQMTYIEDIRPFLRALGRETGLTCVTAQRAADELMIVDKVESSNDIRVTATVGHAYPLSAGAPGKCLMAYLEEEEIRCYAARVGLLAYTPTAITSLDSLLCQLAEVRQDGYAKSLEEYVRGVNVVASPVFDPSGNVMLTVAAMGLTSSLPDDRIDEFGRRVMGIARQATLALGGAWSGPASDSQTS